MSAQAKDSRSLAGTPPQATRPRRRVWRVLALVWLGTLLASYAYRAWAPAPEAPDGAQVLPLPMQSAEGPTEGKTELHWWEAGPASAPPVLLLHGSPGRQKNFAALMARLEGELRTFAPDLPGLGVRPEALPDYSPRAHARYLLEWMKAEGHDSMHVVGFSMGGAVALRLWELDPTRVRSLTLSGSIGVVELELLGDERLNRALHGLLLAGTQAVDWLFPHFGAYDQFPVNVAHARNFYDAKQSEWRALLEGFEPPALIQHGAQDVLVPVEAAREHGRILPQAELVIWEDQNHFLPWAATERMATGIADFVRRVEAGQAPTRSQASPARIAAAATPFDPNSIPPATGFALVILVLLLAFATFASEDLTCLAAGWLVSQGRIAFWPAAGGCFLGILVGDLLLYGIGRLAGRPALERRPLSRWIRPSSLQRAGSWLDRKGAQVVFLSRFTPGLRLPTYLLAGALRTRFVPFALYFALAAALWTPALVGLSAWLGDQFLPRDGNLSAALWRAVPWILGIWLLLHQVLIPALSHTGRRGLVGRWKRWTHFEYWPTWAIYGPLLPALFWQALRYRSATVFSAANPGIEGGGFAGESKSAILANLAPHPAIARHCLVPMQATAEERLQAVERWMNEQGLHFPVVLKPDAGERGRGVQILRSREALSEALGAIEHVHLMQEFIEGQEFGVFFARDPEGGSPIITSITSKHLPELEGDGQRTLERLVLDDARAVAMAKVYARGLADRWQQVPGAGERVRLTQVGTHSLGSIFLDAREHATPELLGTITEISDAMQPLQKVPSNTHPQASANVPGLGLGRYDVKVPSVEDLRAGRNLRVIELNGVTSEPTHIYDPAGSCWAGWRALLAQWQRAFALGAHYRSLGTPVSSIGELWRLARRRG